MPNHRHTVAYPKKCTVYGAFLGFCLLPWLMHSSAHALTYTVPLIRQQIGNPTIITVKSQKTLPEIAAEYDMGIYEMLRANAHLSEKALKANTSVVIPSRFPFASNARVRT